MRFCFGKVDACKIGVVIKLSALLTASQQGRHVVLCGVLDFDLDFITHRNWDAAQDSKSIFVGGSNEALLMSVGKIDICFDEQVSVCEPVFSQRKNDDKNDHADNCCKAEQVSW